MKIVSADLKWETERGAELECRDLTEQVRGCLLKSGVKEGIVNVFVPGSTGSIVSIEAEEGLYKDLRSFVERLVDRNLPYEHQKRWHDDNGHSHIRATLFGASVTIPVRGGQLATGAWQQIVFVEFDVRHPRKRTVMVQIIGQ